MRLIRKTKIVQCIITIILILGVFLLSIIQMKNQDSIKTNSNNYISNKKIGWGIKISDNHKQPDLGNFNKKVIFCS